MTDSDISLEQTELKADNAIPNQVTIAYFILVHRFPEQFKRLFKALYHPENHYLIHLDKKTGISIYEDIEDIPALRVVFIAMLINSLSGFYLSYEAFEVSKADAGGAMFFAVLPMYELVISSIGIAVAMRLAKRPLEAEMMTSFNFNIYLVV